MRAILAVALALVPTLLAADVLHMADGTTREGRVVETTEKEVVVDFGQGSVSLMVRLPKASVLRIEPKASSADSLTNEYAKQLTQALQGDADDWYALGVWCVAQRCLNDKAREAFERAIALDPGHAGARTALGHVKLNDAWMTRDRAIRLLAPDLVDGAKERELAGLKQIEDAKTQMLQAQKFIEELQAKLAELTKENEQFRQKLALPPPPPPDYLRPRVIYRPIIILPPPPGPPKTKDPDTKTPLPSKESDRPRKDPTELLDPKTPASDPKASTPKKTEK